MSSRNQQNTLRKNSALSVPMPHSPNKAPDERLPFTKIISARFSQLSRASRDQEGLVPRQPTISSLDAGLTAVERDRSLIHLAVHAKNWASTSKQRSSIRYRC